MIFVSSGAANAVPDGVCRGLALSLIGEFSAIRSIAARKIPIASRHFLRKYLAACRLSFGCGCPYRLCVPIPLFPLSVGGWRGGLFRQRLFAWGRSDARFREEYYPKNEGGDCSPRRRNHSRLEATESPVLALPFVNGNDCSACLRQGDFAFRYKRCTDVLGFSDFSMLNTTRLYDDTTV